MKHFEKKLPSNDFVRVHRSFIVRLERISTIDMPNVIMEDINKVIQVGGSFKEEFMRRLELL